MLSTILAAFTLQVSEPPIAPSECGEICRFRSTTGEILKLKGKPSEQLPKIYRDYILCYRGDLSMFGSLWVSGKEVETIRNSDRWSWAGLCAEKRIAADAAATKLVSSSLGQDEATVRPLVERYRSGLAFTTAVVFYQKIGKLDALTQYSQEFVRAPHQ